MALPSSLVARAYVIGGAMIFVVALATGTWRFVTLGTAPDEGPLVAGLLINTLLFGVFALHHSVLAREPVKAARVPPGLPVHWSVQPTSGWQASCSSPSASPGGPSPAPSTACRRRGPGRSGALQFAGGILTLDAARRIDLRVLAGLRPEPAQARRSPSRAGTYRFVRHPIYLGWVLLVWAASDMTTGRLVFAAISTAYLVVAVPFEERSLRRRFGPLLRRLPRQVRWRIVPGLY